MPEEIKNVSRDYEGYILKITTYSNEQYDEEGDLVDYDINTETIEFKTADELEAYADAHDLVAYNNDYQIHEWPYETWLEVYATVNNEELFTFEITARERPDELDASYGTEEAKSARALIAKILADTNYYHINGATAIEIIVATDDDWDEPSARAIRTDDGEWEVHEYDSDGNDEVIAEMTPNMDMIWKTPYQASHYDMDSDTLENLPLWICDEGDMVNYYLRRNGEFIDCTNNDSYNFADVPYALVVNSSGGISSIDMIPFKGYVVNGGKAFEHLTDAEREARK